MNNLPSALTPATNPFPVSKLARGSRVSESITPIRKPADPFLEGPGSMPRRTDIEKEASAGSSFNPWVSR